MSRLRQRSASRRLKRRFRDRTQLGQLITAQHVAIARRTYFGTVDGTSLPDDSGTYFASPLAFSATHVRELGPGSEIDVAAAQFRLAYFLELPDSEYQACFWDQNRPTRAYLKHVRKCDVLWQDQSATAHHRRSALARRRQKAASLRVPAEPSTR